MLIVSRNNRRPIYRTFQFRLSKKISYRTSNIEYLRYWKNVISLCFLPHAHSLTQNLGLLLLLKCRSCSLGGYESPWAPGGAIFIPGEIMTRREYWKPFFFTVKSFLEGASWWSQLPLGPNWHLQLLQLLFRYIEAGGIPSILFHYIPLLFSTTICWYPLPFWLPFYFMCARGASSRSG